MSRKRQWSLLPRCRIQHPKKDLRLHATLQDVEGTKEAEGAVTIGYQAFNTTASDISAQAQKDIMGGGIYMQLEGFQTLEYIEEHKGREGTASVSS